ncbi:hypothetical protein QBC39DRAFT_45055 [Podospora conica]|nr:hypothetical protein QBC39DRAFT_45055 [Schizothecium conicum]
MADANGSLKGPKGSKGSKGPKGPKPNGAINGSIKSALNGHAVVPKAAIRTAGPGVVWRTFSMAARLLTWYCIITVALRCPSTPDACDETSPRICKPYYQIRQAVTPHLEPYYAAYAAPYVDLVRPYYHTVDQRVIAPGWGYAQKYGAPQVERAQAFAHAQWQKNVQPQITKGQDFAKLQYNQNLAPHVNHVSTTLGPYIDIAQTSALQTYHELLLPTYTFVQPYALQGYQAASTFTKGTAVPSVVWAWNKTNVFLDSTVWPHLRVIYVENVEPQLIKIGKRLGRYSSSKKMVPKPIPEVLSSPASKTTSSFVKLTPSASSAVVPTISGTSSVFSTPSASSVVAAAANEVPSKSSSSQTSQNSDPVDSKATWTKPAMDPVTPPEIDETLENEDPVRREARLTVAADLQDWQNRFVKAAKEGSAEIDREIQTISERMIRRQARGMGMALLDELQGSIITELVHLRRNILQVVGTVAKGNVSPEEGQEQIGRVVRKAGMEIKDKAKDVRSWRESYELELQAAITKAADSHLNILHNIRDLALQKIGMKWAWTEGVTYKDWAKYHQLKDRFEEWTRSLQSRIVTHPSLEAAQLEAANIEDEAMKLAATAAKELARLKQVGGWKLVAADDTTEFDSTLMQQAAEAVEAARIAAAKVADNVVDSVGGAVGDASSAAAAAAGAATDAAKQAKNAAVGEAEKVVESSTVSEVVQVTESVVNEVPAPSVDAADAKKTESLETSAEPSLVADSAPSDLASSVILEETPVFFGNTSESVEDGPGPVELPYEGDAEVAAVEEPAVPSAAPTKSVFLGVAAQAAPSRKPVIEDALDDAAGALEAMRQELQSAYSVATSRANSQYAQAISIMSVQIHGTPEPHQAKMLASLTEAYSNAMATASSHMDEAIKAASTKVYGTPTKTNKILPTAIPAMPTVPTVEWAQIESIASERLNQGRAWAEEQYESAKIAIGLATPTPSTPSEHVNRALENARHNYYAGLGVAHARYSEFMAAASSAFSSMTATPTPTDLAGTVSSLGSVANASVASAVSVASDNAASAASVVGEGAASAASVVTDNAASAASVVSDNAASAASFVSDNAAYAASVASENVSSAASVASENAASAVSKVGEGWDVVVNKISIEIYGAPTPTPWYASVYSAAGDNAASATSAAGAYATAASDELSSQFQAVSSILSEALVGKEPTFSESVISRVSAAYATAAASASSFGGAARASVVSVAGEAAKSAQSVGSVASSVASEATEAVKETVGQGKDEL